MSHDTTLDRRSFLRRLLVAGTGSAVAACAEAELGLYDDFDVNFDGSVLVVGAGAAGLAAGYLLDRYGVAFEIVEAMPRFGGRVLRADGFADFPIDLGAEWLHDTPSTLASLVDDPRVDARIDLVRYAPESMYAWADGELRRRNFASPFYGEYKFKRTTWYGFLEQFIAPASLDRISYDTAVTRIDRSGGRVRVETSDGAVREADRVIVTVPIKVLQDGGITFEPALPSDTSDAISRVDVPAGLKGFVRFDRAFYPDLILDGRLLDSGASDRLYYDAAFRKGADSAVCALFWVDEAARAWADLTDDEIGERMVDDLDRMFDGAASRRYQDHIVQNWTAEPYVRGAYSVSFRGGQYGIVSTLRRPVDGTLFFAGEALSITNQATVHGAMQSAYATVEQLLANESVG